MVRPKHPSFDTEWISSSAFVPETFGTSALGGQRSASPSQSVKAANDDVAAAIEHARAAATLNDQFRHRIFVNALLWPKVTRGCPDYWRAYAKNWSEIHRVPANLAPSTAAAVVHVIVDAMRCDGDSAVNAFCCFPRGDDRAPGSCESSDGRQSDRVAARRADSSDRGHHARRNERRSPLRRAIHACPASHPLGDSPRRRATAVTGPVCRSLG
jgi:hypothetical protein